MSGQNEQFDEFKKTQLLEQYKLYVEMSDHVSERRIETNKFFISVHTALTTLISIFGANNNMVMMLTGTMGILFSIIWFILLQNYRQLNSGKFKVIHDMEKSLPCAPYKDEWVILMGDSRRKYGRFSKLEISLPAIFCILYLFLLMYAWYCLGSGFTVSPDTIQITPIP